MRISLGALGLTLIFSLSLLGETYRGSDAEKSARRQGRELLREQSFDIDGDGTQEIALVERHEGELRVSVVEALSDGRFQPVITGSGAEGGEIVRFEVKNIVGEVQPEVVLVVKDDSPDESALHVRVLGNTTRGPREIFTRTFFMPREKGAE